LSSTFWGDFELEYYGKKLEENGKMGGWLGVVATKVVGHTTN